MSSNPFFPSRQPGPSLHVLFIVLALCGAQAGFVEPAFAERSTHSVLTQSGYLKASNTGLGDEFGSSVAASGGTIIVGAEWEDSAAIGVDGNQLDDSAANAGAAYIFERSAIGRWSQQAYLKASNTEGGDRFGHAVALSDNLAAVGAFSEDSAAPGIDGDELDNSLPDAGAVYVFVRDSAGTWTQDAYIKASSPDENDQFGMALAISGNTLVVGVAGEDSGSSGINGDPFDNSLQEAGAVYVFVRDEEGSWTQQAYIKASNPDESDNFGASVAIDGDLLVVGAKFEDGSASGVDANQSDNSASNAGAAYVFVRNEEGQWSQQAYLKPSNTDAGDQFGFSVAASGDTVLVGSFRESSASGGDQQDNSAQWAGAAYVFVRDAEDIWSQQAYLKASNPDEIDYFGESVGLSGDAAIVGAYTEDSASTGVDGDQTDNSASDSGAVYAFVRGSSGGWSQLAYLKASNAEAFDRFGRAVAVSGSTIVAAADTESSGAEGVDGHQDNNDVSGSGAVYLFTPPDRELEVTRIGQGQVISDPAGIQCPSNCQIDFPFDIQVELSAIAAPGWRFDQWAGGCTGSGSCQVTMDEDRLVGARFIRQRTLSVVISGQGRVTSQQPGIDCPETCEAEFDQDSEVLLIATPEPGWVFSSWGGAASSCGSSLQCTVTLDANRTAGALFEVVEDRVFRDRFEVRD